MFRLQMSDGREVLAHAALGLRMAFTRLLAGDQVLAEISPFDPNKARILRLLKSSHRQENPSIQHPQQRELS
jgi:translation initiation factor IF-1